VLASDLGKFSAPRIDVAGLGTTYQVRIARDEGEKQRTFRDADRDCDRRAHFAAVFIVVTLLLPDVLQEPPSETPPASPVQIMSNAAAGANVALQDFQSSIPTGVAVPTSPWMADETISSNGSWCFVNPMTYKSAATVINELDQINAAGGIMLLNVSPEKDGAIPKEQIDILNAVGKHLGAPWNF
jgi:hypothetical protein